MVVNVSGGYQYIPGNPVGKRIDVFGEFIEEILPSIPIVALKPAMYKEIIRLIKEQRLDFDDAYQFALAKSYGFKIATMDKDFRKVHNEVEIEFLK